MPWKDTGLYTKIMLERSVDSYLAHAKEEGVLFFDRGIPDTLAYAQLRGGNARIHIAMAGNKDLYFLRGKEYTIQIKNVNNHLMKR